MDYDYKERAYPDICTFVTVSGVSHHSGAPARDTSLG
jgi:hypothetical protein